MSDQNSVPTTHPSDRFAGRTIHGIPLFARELAADPVLRVSGLVSAPRDLTQADLRLLERASYEDVRAGDVEASGGVTRRTPESPEPPWLVLMRDDFAVCLTAAIVFSSLLFGAIVFFFAAVGR